MSTFSYEKLRELSFFGENRLPAHSRHRFYASLEEAERGESSLVHSLNGLWRFHYAQNQAGTVPEFWSAELDCHGWAQIRVPGHIQLQGYGRPQYVNVAYPWDGCQQVPWGGLPEETNPVGSYVDYFYLPEQMAGRRVCISFQGVESCFALWLNGQYVGFSADSFAAHDFELTDFLRPGENKLAVQVWQWCRGSWMEDQDFFRFSGIYRDVWLYALPEVHVWDLKAEALLEENCASGLLRCTAKLETAGAWRGTAVLSFWGETVWQEDFSGSGNTLTLEHPMNQPALWSAEQPNLYKLTLILKNGAGETVEVVSQRVGFRRFELKNGLMLLNGKRIVFNGVNRHDFSCDHGRAVRPEEIRRDLVTMKRNNINALRTSHYTNSSLVYELCDELGLYVIAENNLESHGTWEHCRQNLQGLEPPMPKDDMDWLPLLLDRVESTYQGEKNHPSILIWSCGNESYGGKVIWELSQRFRALDSIRLVHYEGIFHDRSYPDTSDMESQMYTSAQGIRDFLAAHPEKPFLCCEYSHAMGNSCGGMHKYTQLAEKEPRYQGGFLWDWIDQTLRCKDRFGRETLAYGGDFDERPTDGNFSGDGLCFGDGTETPKLQEVKYNYQGIRITLEQGRALIWNKNLFTDTGAYEARLTLARNGREIWRTGLAISVPPETEETVPLPLPQPKEPGEYAATLSFHLKEDTPWAARGHEVAFGQTVWTVAGEKKRPQSWPLTVIPGGFHLGVRGDRFSLLFRLTDGALISYRYGGEELLKEPLRPNFWRAPTDNDLGWQMPGRLGQWKLASQYGRGLSQMESDGWRMEHGDLIFPTRWLLPTTPAAECGVTYTVHPWGEVEVTLDWPGAEGLPLLPELGMLLQTDARYDRLTWYGNGPGECYQDRDQGARLGIWESMVQAQLTRYPRPQECGSHTGVRWLRVTDRQGRGLELRGDCMECSALSYTPFQMEEAAHHYELPPVCRTVLRPALARMGVGGDNSWGALPLEEYRLDSSIPRRFVFSFTGV